jgi:plastocyanin
MRRSTVVAPLGLVVLAIGVWATAAAADPVASDSTVPSTTTTTAAPPSTTTPGITTTTTWDPVNTTTPRTHTAASARAGAPAGGQDPAVVDIIGSGGGCAFYCFSPAQLTVAAGAPVKFTNTSNADHTVVRCTPAACSGASPGTGTDTAFASVPVSLPVGGSFSFSFNAPGTYVYYCSIHGYVTMHGTITVTAATTTTVTPLPSTAPTPTPAAVSNTNALAHTGGSVDGVSVIGAGALVAGLAAIAFGSRRRTQH